VHTTLDAGEAYTTLSLEVKMVRAITVETPLVRAEGEVLYRGRRQATAQAKLTDAATGKLLAHGTSTCMIIGS
jgi:acyl-coenzyme A thioesterase PaaI-like protein